jgi:hypothetical protein
MNRKDQTQLASLVEELILGIGGRRTKERELYEFSLPTKAGELRISRKGTWIACRFDNPSQAVALLGAGTPAASLNPYSGKWNHHFGRTDAAHSAYTEFWSALRLVLTDEQRVAQEEI